MTNTELAVLGLVAEGQGYGYQIEQAIAARGMREWTEIGFSSIYYVLNKLENSGWLSSAPEVGGGAPGGRLPGGAPGGGSTRRGPARRVYALTESGFAAYRAAVLERLAHPRPRSGDFELALGNLPALRPDEIRAALQTCRAGLRARQAQVQEKWAADRAAQPPAGEGPSSALPPHVDALFDRSLALLAAELDWIEAFIQQWEA